MGVAGLCPLKPVYAGDTGTTYTTAPARVHTAILDWDDSTTPGVTYCLAYRNRSAEFTDVLCNADRPFTLSTDRDVFVTVFAVDVDGNQSAYSNQVLVDYPETLAVDNPDVLTSTPQPYVTIDLNGSGVNVIVLP